MNKVQFFLLLVFFTTQINSYAQTYQDCKKAFPVCDFKTYHFGQMNGIGDISESISKSTCFDHQFKETNSFWLRWKAEESGTLTFVINPNQEDDDFDFILFRRESKDCQLLTEVRCMAAGQNIGENDTALNDRCKGRTGLSFSSIDEFESQGCRYSSDNFLKMLQMEEGEEFVLLVNNYDSQHGYSITFEGDSQLHSYEDCNLISVSEPLMIVNLYPNPAINSVNIEYLTQKIDPLEIDLLDISGKSYHHFDIIPELGKNKNTFLLSDMTKGSYLLRIRQGKFTTVRQFIKQ